MYAYTYIYILIRVCVYIYVHVRTYVCVYILREYVLEDLMFEKWRNLTIYKVWELLYHHQLILYNSALTL